MDKFKKLRKKELKLVGFKPEGFERFRRMDVTKTGAFKDARQLLNKGKPSVGIYWIPDLKGKKTRYTYKVTKGFKKGWKKKGWQKIIEIS